MDWVDVDGQYKGIGPDGLVEVQREMGGYVVLDLVQGYVNSLNRRESTKRWAYSVLRSFFLHNRAALPQDSSFRIRGDRPKVVGGVSVEELRFILSGCNEMYHAVFLCMFQGGMGIGELVYWSDHGLASLKTQLREDAVPLRVDLPGRKKSKYIRPFYTFIGSNAVDAVRRWMKIRPPEAETIFVNQYGDPLTTGSIQRYWKDHCFKSGVVEKPEKRDIRTRYGKNPHELRDLFRTRWQKSGRAPEVAEFFMGHNIDPLGYNKAMSDKNYTRNEYRQASKWLNIISEDPEHIHIDEVEDMRTELKDEIMEEVMRTLRLNLEIQKRKELSP